MLPCQNQLYPSSRFDTIPSCDGQAHDDSIYRASIASRGKNANTINTASSTAIWGKHKHDDSQTSLVPDILHGSLPLIRAIRPMFGMSRSGKR